MKRLFLRPIYAYQAVKDCCAKLMLEILRYDSDKVYAARRRTCLPFRQLLVDLNETRQDAGQSEISLYHYQRVFMEFK